MRFNARFIPCMSINITLYIKVDLYYKISSEYHVFKLRIIYLFIVYIFTSIFYARANQQTYKLRSHQTLSNDHSLFYKSSHTMNNIFTAYKMPQRWSPVQTYPYPFPVRMKLPVV